MKSFVFCCIVLSIMMNLTPTHAQSPDDSFLWLEEVNGERALEWVRARNAATVAELERVPVDGYFADHPDWETVLDIDALSAEENENWAYAGITITSTRPPDGGGAGYVWLGGTDRVTEGTWVWDGENSGSGTQFWQGPSAANGGTAVNGLYSNWGNEPDNYGAGPTHPGQDALAIALSNWPLGMAGQWNDLRESNQLYYIIEHPGIVPVELMSFAAERYADGVRLEWRTATETNNLGWTVERRDAGQEWMARGFVPGAGTTMQAQRYSFADEAAVGDVLEYRLRQVDLDGSVEYSHSLRIHAAGAVFESRLLPNHPNPFNNQTTISYYIEGAVPASLLVTDLAGREVLRIDHSAGGPPGLRTARFDASRLPPGMYFCRLVSGSLIHSRVMLLLR